MTTIRRFPFVSHATSAATRFLIQTRSGQLVVRGPGASFWFRPLGTTLAEVPIEDQEFGTIFAAITQDRQEVSIQTALTVRIENPELAAQRLDFAVDLGTGEWTAQPLRTLQNRIGDLARQYAAQAVAGTTLDAVLADGLVTVREAIATRFAAEAQLSDAGIAVVGVRVVGVRPEEEVERALQTKVREAIQAEADRATYERRAQAVDRERAIKENELNNRTELARREAELVELTGANERRRTEQELERERLRAQESAAAKRLDVDARVDEIARVAEAENQALAVKLATFDGADTAALLGSIAPDLLAALPAVESVTITPDTLTNALAGVLAQAKAVR